MSLLKGLNLLEQSYNSKNWDGIKEAYFLISGEKIGDDVVPTKTVKKPGQPKKSVSVKLDIEQQTIVEPQETKESRATRKTSIQFGKNKFVDDGELAIEDKEYDNKPRKKWKKPNKRDAHTYKNVNCSTKNCKTIVLVDPELYLYDSSYFCNKCLNTKR